MLEISTSGLMSGDGKRSGPFRAQPPRPSSTLLIVAHRLGLFLLLSFPQPHPRSSAVLIDELDAGEL
jgi:hypothetical protein